MHISDIDTIWYVVSAHTHHQLWAIRQRSGNKEHPGESCDANKNLRATPQHCDGMAPYTGALGRGEHRDIDADGCSAGGHRARGHRRTEEEPTKTPETKRTGLNI